MIRPIGPEFEGGHGNRRAASFLKALVSKRTITLRADLDNWSVQSKDPAANDDQSDGRLTAAEYATIQDAFDFS
jgi:hypothetical protein